MKKLKNTSNVERIRRILSKLEIHQDHRGSEYIHGIDQAAEEIELLFSIAKSALKK